MHIGKLCVYHHLFSIKMSVPERRSKVDYRPGLEALQVSYFWE